MILINLTNQSIKVRTKEETSWLLRKIPFLLCFLRKGKVLFPNTFWTTEQHVFVDRTSFLPFTDEKKYRGKKLYCLDLIQPILIFTEKEDKLVIGSDVFSPLLFGERYIYLLEFFSDNEELRVSHIHLSYGKEQFASTENQKISLVGKSSNFSFSVTRNREFISHFDNVRRIS
jgi:hypothetical protein